MKRSKFFFLTGLSLMIFGLLFASPPPVVFAGITPTATFTPAPPTETPTPTETAVPPTSTPTPIANTPIPATNTPRPNTDTPIQATATPIPTPEAIPELGFGPSTSFVSFGTIGILLGGLFILLGWLQLLKE